MLDYFVKYNDEDIKNFVICLFKDCEINYFIDDDRYFFLFFKLYGNDKIDVFESINFFKFKKI